MNHLSVFALVTVTVTTSKRAQLCNSLNLHLLYEPDHFQSDTIYIFTSS
jgi:hypothetical protein